MFSFCLDYKTKIVYVKVIPGSTVPQIHCVNEIEARGLSEVGIYRVPG